MKMKMKMKKEMKDMERLEGVRECNEWLLLVTGATYCYIVTVLVCLLFIYNLFTDLFI
jgi:hypothetical protein